MRYNKIHKLCYAGDIKQIMRMIGKEKYRSLFEQADNDGESSLHVAAKTNHPAICKLIIDQYPHLVGFVNGMIRTPLYYLIDNPTLLQYVFTTYPDHVRFNMVGMDGDYLLKQLIVRSVDDPQFKPLLRLAMLNGARLDTPVRSPPLIVAAKRQNLYAVELFIQHGADVNIRNHRLETAVGYSVFRGNLPITRSLTEAGADLNYRGHEGKNNPVDYCIMNKNYDLLLYLIQNGYDLNNKEYTLSSDVQRIIIDPHAPAELVAAALYYGDLTSTDIKGNTPIHSLLTEPTRDWRHYDQILRKKLIDPRTRNRDGASIISLIPTNQKKQFKRMIQAGSKYRLDTNPIAKRRLKCTGNCPKLSSIRMSNYPAKNFGRFSADYLNGMAYLLNILQKYPQLFIPFQYYYNPVYATDTNDRCFIMYRHAKGNIIGELTSIYLNFGYELAPSLIVWGSKSFYYFHPRLKLSVWKALHSPKIRFVYIKLSFILTTRMTHANGLILDKQTGIMERFEPYGTLKVADSDVMDDRIEQMMRQYTEPYFKKKGVSFQYLRPSDFLPDVGFQTIGNDAATHYRKLGDPGGYCLAWSLLYLETRVKNPTLHPKQLVEKMYGFIQNRKLKPSGRDDPLMGFINYIRDYTHQLDKEKNHLLKKFGIDKMSFYNNVWNDDDLQRISTGFSRIIGRLVKERGA